MYSFYTLISALLSSEVVTDEHFFKVHKKFICANIGIYFKNMI